MYIKAKDLIESYKISYEDLHEMLAKGLIKNMFYAGYMGEMRKVESVMEIAKEKLKFPTENFKQQKEDFKSYWIGIKNDYNWDKFIEKNPINEEVWKQTRKDRRSQWLKKIKDKLEWDKDKNKIRIIHFQEDKHSYYKELDKWRDPEECFRRAMNNYVWFYRMEYEQAAKKLVTMRLAKKGE